MALAESPKSESSKAPKKQALASLLFRRYMLDDNKDRSKLELALVYIRNATPRCIPDSMLPSCGLQWQSTLGLTNPR